MRIFYPDTYLSLLLSVLLWLFFQLSAVYISQRLPRKYFDSNNYLFRSYAWEDNGNIYERLFLVRRWKQRLPDGGALYRKKAYKKRYLTSYGDENLLRFLEESARGELAHWLAIWPFIFFSLFVEAYVVLMMLFYALAVNLPCIMAQRYNRPRIKKILEKRNKSVSQAISATDISRS